MWIAAEFRLCQDDRSGDDGGTKQGRDLTSRREINDEKSKSEYDQKMIDHPSIPADTLMNNLDQIFSLASEEFARDLTNLISRVEKNKPPFTVGVVRPQKVDDQRSIA
ncbi:hypothetical protein GWI33_005467 [Rhynchophorus ferrugineus]|uniref:Uncharacterized protein n=1 Tax=Rhynchophorus ferrugineus TaxID=354439 RepID=A0A834IJ85_RHYFE|nr:hypothetical protein GWI33_005467 [Rhynchophorus ferrugineus]